MAYNARPEALTDFVDATNGTASLCGRSVESGHEFGCGSLAEAELVVAI